MALAASRTIPALPAKQRLLEAAARVFATHGFDGATTREIALAAGVNEVTLFRLFQSKENLQSAVLRRVFDQQAELLAARPQAPFSADSDLRAEILRIAQNYLAALQQNIGLIRTLLGEIHRYRDQEKELLYSIFDPLKAELIATVENAQQTGHLRAGLDPQMAISMLPGMILSDTLRRNTDPCKIPPYGADEYLAACVDVFIRGVSA